MSKPFREIRHQIDQEVAHRSPERNGEGRVAVDMTVKDDSEFLSAFSETDTPVISSGVAEFLEARTRSIPPKEELTLRIHSDCIDQEEQVLYQTAIREYYTEQYIANRREIQRNRILSTVLLAAGVAILAIAILLDYRADSPVWAEVVDIAAWVLIWEAVDISLLENKSLRFRERRYLSFISMAIEYAP